MRPYSVLLVDDESDVRTIAELSLGTVGGFDVLLAESGQQALSILSQHLVDVIVLDVMMPGMDGITVLAELRKNDAWSQIPVIFMTAKVQRRETDEYLAVGACGVIHKPFDPMLLADRVRELAGLDDKNSRLQRRLDRLKLQYSQRLSQRIGEVLDAVETFRRTPSESTRAEAHVLAHRMHGTAGSYGFHSIGRTAGEIESLLAEISRADSHTDAVLWARLDQSLASLSNAIPHDKDSSCNRSD